MQQQFGTDDSTVLVGEQTYLTALASIGHGRGSKAQLPLVSHSHKDKYEFLIVISGIQKVVIDDESFTLYSGDVLVVRPNEMHFSATNPQPDNDILWFQIDLSQKAGFLELQPHSAYYVYNRILGFEGRKFQIDSDLMNGFLKSFSAIAADDAGQKLKGHSLFTYCLLSLIDMRPTLKLLSHDVDYAKQYILTHVEETIDMDILASDSKLSTYRFKQKFKDEIGLSPREFINFAKVHKSKRRVANTRDSIADIAYDFSFSSVNHFKNLFKQYTGYSPKAYRQKRDR